MKRKAKFKVGQVVWYRGRHGDTLQKLSARKYFLEDPGWGYQFEDSLDAGFREEEKLRPLTRREKGDAR